MSDEAAYDRRTHPPYDRELAALVAPGAVDGHSLRDQDIPRLRELNASWHPRRDELDHQGAVWPEERIAVGVGGHPDVPVVILWPTSPWDHPRPVVIACHGGGLVTGDAYSGTPALASWTATLGTVVISPTYRLAPEHRYPAALDDIMTTLSWVHRHHDELGVDPGRVAVFGISAGAGLAAATCLRARDEGDGLLPCAQILQDAMLDDRHRRPSTYEHVDSGVWDRISSQTSWKAYLGALSGSDAVTPYAAPGRAADTPALLAGLPPAHLDVGGCDLFRDDVLAYATALTQAGVPTELHLWPGGWHGFSEMAPHTELGRAANETRTHFLRRMLAA